VVKKESLAWFSNQAALRSTVKISSWTCGTGKSRLRRPLLSPEFHSTMQEFRVTEERKFAILFAATILAARKLIDMDPNKTEHGEGVFRGQGNR
jgi:hypothetical protein